MTTATKKPGLTASEMRASRDVALKERRARKHREEWPFGHKVVGDFVAGQRVLVGSKSGTISLVSFIRAVLVVSIEGKLEDVDPRKAEWVGSGTYAI